MTIRDVISQLRTLIKANNVDAFITDRFLWSVITKHTDSAIFKYRHSTNIVSSPDLYTTLFGLEMQEASLLDLSCLSVSGLSDCIDIKIYKSVKQIPDIRVINDKYLIKSVTSVDFSYLYNQISFGGYNGLLNNRFRRVIKDSYYSIMDKHLWIFDINNKREGIGAVNITAAFRDAAMVSEMNMCDECDKECTYVQDGDSGIPSSLLGEIISASLNEILASMYQLNFTTDNHDNKHIANNE